MKSNSRIKVVISLAAVVLSGCTQPVDPPASELFVPSTIHLRLQTQAVSDIARSSFPDSRDGATVQRFSTNRFSLYASAITDGLVDLATPLYFAEMNDDSTGIVPVSFGQEPQELAMDSEIIIPPSIDILYFSSSAHAVFDGSDWFGQAYGVDAASYTTGRKSVHTHGFYLDDDNYYVDPGTGRPVSFREFDVAFINREMIPIVSPMLIHYTKTAGRDDSDFDNDVWEYGALSASGADSDFVVDLLNQDPAFEFTGSRTSSINDVYRLVVPVDPIPLAPGMQTVATMQVDLTSLVSKIELDESAIEGSAAVEYSLDEHGAPMSFLFRIEQFPLPAD